MDVFAQEPPENRAAAFTEGAANMGVQPMIIEKDFWVTWTLKRLFLLSSLPASFILKGGTSLSKVYGAIHRFSEDIDLSLDRRDLGFIEEDDPASEGLSNHRRKELSSKWRRKQQHILALH